MDFVAFAFERARKFGHVNSDSADIDGMHRFPRKKRYSHYTKTSLMELSEP